MRLMTVLLLVTGSLGCGASHGNDDASVDASDTAPTPDAIVTPDAVLPDTEPPLPEESCAQDECASAFHAPVGLMPRVQLENLIAEAFGTRVSLEFIANETRSIFSSGGFVSPLVLERMLSTARELADGACADGCDADEVDRKSVV